MTFDNLKKKAGPSTKGKPALKSAPADPEWANGLRQLYDSVVDEPIPDNFKDLLSKLDSKA